MQIICNSCLSCRIYSKIYNLRFNNPFISCTWSPATMIKFIKHYKNINYMNIKISLSEINDIHFKTPHIICTIDNLLTIHYVHSDKAWKNDFDVFKDRYFTRLSRFNVNEEPIFILGLGFEYGHTFNYDIDYANCIKFNFMNVKTIQYSSSIKDLPAGHNYNKFIYLDNIAPSYIYANYAQELKNTINELLNVRN